MEKLLYATKPNEIQTLKTFKRILIQQHVGNLFKNQKNKKSEIMDLSGDLTKKSPALAFRSVHTQTIRRFFDKLSVLKDDCLTYHVPINVLSKICIIKADC